MTDYNEYWENHVQPALDFLRIYIVIAYPVKLLLNFILGYLLITTIDLNDGNILLVTNLVLFVTLFSSNFLILLFLNGRAVRGPTLLIRDLSNKGRGDFTLVLKCSADLTLKVCILNLTLQFFLLALDLMKYQFSSLASSLMALFFGWLWSVLFPLAFLKIRVQFGKLQKDQNG